MKPHFHSLMGLVTLLALVLSSCALPHPAQDGFYIAGPRNGQDLTLGASVLIKLDAILPPDPNRYTLEANLIDNGVVIAHLFYHVAGQPGTTRYHETYTIQHESAGGHIISAQGRAIDIVNSTTETYSDWYPSNILCFFVGPNPPSSSQLCGYRSSGSFLSAATVTPTLTPTPIPVIDSAQAYPNPIYYGETCPSISTVTFRAALTLPSDTTPDLVEVQAHVRVIIGASETNSGSLLVPLTSNGTWDTSTGGQVFAGTIALTHSYNDAANHFDPASLGGGLGALLWYVDVSRHDPTYSTATFLDRSASQVLSLAPCPASGHNPPRNSNNGNGNGTTVTGCAQYTNQTSCNLGGCSWNPQNSSCTVNP